MFLSKLKMFEYQFKVFRTLFVSDEEYRRKKFKKIFGKEVDLTSPKTLNEKINYRMVNQRSDFFTLVADKISVRDYVELTIGREYLVPLLGVFEKPEEIEFSRLPLSFVMKCNHDSGSAIICNNKYDLDLENVMRHFKQHLKRNPYYTNREWQYKNIKPHILIEEKVELFRGKSRDTTPEMFRIHCFHGRPHIIEVDFTSGNGNEYVNIYNPEWELQSFTLGYANTPNPIDRPESFNKMLRLASKIAIDFDYCRLDFMASDDAIFFSEITLTPESGQLKFNPPEWDAKLGRLWVL
ncbi:glycosyltransferase [Klebsiella pneumoniae]|uniref:ATP-grasp fold amidoligase family protein n=1 Tax=Enterobacteriaceae TaxID=543 RepID=UPI001E52F8DA|nr:ATP-grasp fold amidoligase family protein [Klebsiella pneumoniae]MCD5767412.1 glycosyltransferase [Klebsiella pneumoniae]UGN03072.1 glycosyltransferase [Klebsiella pneumoniae]